MEDSDRRTARTHRNENPYKNANILSKLFFCWPLPLFYRGLKKELNEEDLFAPLDEFKSNILGDALENAWKNQNKDPSLWRALLKVFGWEIFIVGVMHFTIEMGIKMMHPLCLAKLMQYYVPNQKIISENEAYIYASLIVLASFLNVLLGHTLMFRNINLGMKIRVACCSVVYRKALKISKSSLAETTVGQMVNLLSNDVNRFDSAFLLVHNIWIAPIQIILVVYFLFTMLGPMSLFGIIVLILFIPLQIYLSEKTSKYRFKIAIKTDERVRLMNEIICGIQVIKMYTWEKPFAKLVEISRKLEVNQIKGTSYIRAINLSLVMFMHRSAVFACILSYVLFGNEITAYYVFVAASFYNILRVSITMHFPTALASMAETRVSVSRLKQFLLKEEVIENINTDSNVFTDDVGIVMRNLSAKWTVNNSDNTLTNVSFDVGPKELVAVIGPVGGGKSSLLNVILGELNILDGYLNVNGIISYAPQEAWLFSGSIRQNILFGEEMDISKYEEVVRVCALVKDFKLLQYGDRTIVGERGVMLSGGQKARINLARALYKDADIYLLDDPLSAVDTQVGKYLFENCILGYLKDKCTVLVTHQLQYMRVVNRIYLIEYGNADMFGTYEEFQISESNFIELLEEVVEKENEENKSTGITLKEPDIPEEIREHKSRGSVKRTVYLAYFKAAGGYASSILILLLFFFAQVAASMTDYFNGFWVNLEQKRKHNEGYAYTENIINTIQATLTTINCIYIYSGLIASIIILTLLRSLVFMFFCMVASKRMHNNMFARIVNATMRFFNTNPSGRILNRFSKDTGAVDEVLPSVILDTLQVGLTVLAVTVVISTINPWTLIVTVVILFNFYWFRVVFLKSSRNIKRMEGTTRSPVFTHLSASLQGLSTIRAFNAQEILVKEFDNHQDLHSSAYYLFSSCNRAFGFWLDIHCVIYIAIVTLSFLLMKVEVYGGNVGLAITQSLALTGMFQWGMRQWSEWENQMTSVERVLEYTEVEQELDEPIITCPESWPEYGKIEFKSVSLKYSEDENYVLNNLDFLIKANEKIGIVGRTGAGKSSIISSLFRLSRIEGNILIDDVDIKTISLIDLRSNISIIPQDPVLFSGTLRKNLDPFNQYTDNVLWSALEDVKLKTVVSDLPAGLNSTMSEGGQNFSVGQRQLICLARAIVRKNKILVMDEATANVDPHTDELIQKTIRKKFEQCTVLTIAHRLHTIMDSDKVLVMNAGVVVEFDSPYSLLKNKCGYFYLLVMETGKSMSDNLFKIANQSYKKTR